ncbi:MAG: eukaryotic-like serine/threonine-protein kinase [Candidatus Sumerlaeota bacterium]|nr:eukaryotic-like serine/threonine-protein kinase [Candidatus Sumerlaeota bacterium]
MNLVCANCKHQWEEEAPPGAQSVLCPECLAPVPFPGTVRIGGDAVPTAYQRTAVASPPTARIPQPRPEAETRDLGQGGEGVTTKIGGHAVAPEIQGNEPTSKLAAGSIPADPGKTTPLPPEGGAQTTGITQPPPPKPQQGEHRATDVAPKKVRNRNSEYDALIGKTLGGYRIEKLLGAGGMGAVFLAHQVSLDRKIALKVLPERFAKSPELLARFTREALSAGHLNHHNVMQVYDVGHDQGIHYISMEFVKGENLGDVIRRDGPLRVDDAAGYILQAARGLHYAHKRGVIHRDIKPDNIMINEHGVVKIADLGLAKMIGHSIGKDEVREYDESEMKKAIVQGELTEANVAFGTPAYMAPEQSRDTANVDSRADQYSLGCTLYYLCAGRAPYDGTTVFDLISKHREAPLTPLDAHVRGVPPAFSRILERMLAKAPNERYPTLEDAATDLEHYLGLDHEGGQYKPRDQHLAILEECVKDYYALPGRKLRRLAAVAFWILMPILVILSFATKSFPLIGAALGLFFFIPFMSFVVNGVMGRTYLFRRVRSVFFGMPWMGWLKLAGIAAGAGAFLVLTGWIWPWLGVALAALGIALAYQFAVLRPLKKQKVAVVERTNDLLKELRVRGVSEDALREFVSRFSGAQWEEFFEEFFAYEDKVLARARMASQDKVQARKKFATWRDPIFRWMDKVDEQRRAAKERKTLQSAEKGRLKAEGMSEEEAQAAAELEATRIIESEFAGLDDEEIIQTKRRLPIWRLLKMGFRLVRLGAGLVMVGYGAAFFLDNYGVSVPAEVTDFYSKTLQYHTLGLPADKVPFMLSALLNLLGGVGLIILTFSRRIVAPSLAVLGALLLVFAKPIMDMAQQPLLQPGIVLIAATVLMTIGVGYCLMGRLTGENL